MKINTFFSIIISKTVLKLSKFLFKGGTSFPGIVALKFDKKILMTLADGWNVILVTGTNGKTTTTSMVYCMLKDSGKKVISNSSGANMYAGIVACFISNYSFRKSDGEKYAVIEVDEANVKFITAMVSPKIISVTNLFRDQLDRYGELYTTLNKIMDGIEKTPSAKLVLNGDESLLGDLGLVNDAVYFGFNTPIYEGTKVEVNSDAKFCKKCKSPYKYYYLTYNHLGSFYCDVCGYERPALKYSLDKLVELTPDGSMVELNGNQYYINIPGAYNIYNALCAFAIAKELGIDNESIFDSLKSQKSSFGRQEIIDIDGKRLRIILVKNPAGCDQAIDTVSLESQRIGLALMLNDNFADGRDVSWIWDVKFEKFSKLDLEKILISGIRLYDMALRFKLGGLPVEKFLIKEDHEKFLNGIKNIDSDTVYLLATYTAMISFRKFLNTKGYIKELW
ncbi:MAG: MurT ligase domain-containing protein [Clostridiaceae bacterium]